eukprot:TRINITY_DN8121_c0_g1_i1.p1 TRINITY_DN8121_c0_g1~~TRINITY_DN8121_c0_g1_i1.p1  ORF type:complete len:955 (-),score=115.92 TRINITY_DN8121_c0_g1_i1:297-3161(-)
MAMPASSCPMFILLYLLCLLQLQRGIQGARTQASVIVQEQPTLPHRDAHDTRDFSSSELEVDRVGGHEEFLPDEQLYPRNFEGPKNLTEPERLLVHDRIARCYEPRADEDYRSVSWEGALHAYMKEQVKRGLRKVSRVIIYDMPHVWGDHSLTSYLPHHWIAAIVPDIEKKPSSHCLEFDYDGSHNGTDDPNGCLFFRRSFQPTQKLTKCVQRALEHSKSWEGRQAIARANGLAVHKVDFQLSVFHSSTGTVSALKTLWTAWHSKWNNNADIIKDVVNETHECSMLRSQNCKNGTMVRVIEPCAWLNTSKANATLECERRSAGGDDTLAKFLQDKDIVLAGQMCATNSTPELRGHIALVEGAGCPEDEKIKKAIEFGAAAVLLQTLPGQTFYRGAQNGELGGLKPIPTFAVSARTVNITTAYLKSLQNKDKNLTAGDARLRIHRYQPVLAKGADIVPNFAEEVRIWEAAGDAVSSSSTLDRAFELVKMVSMETLSRSSLDRAKFTVARAARRSMTQPRKSEFDQIDAATEEAIFQCYHLSDPPTTTTTTTSTPTTSAAPTTTATTTETTPTTSTTISTVSTTQTASSAPSALPAAGLSSTSARLAVDLTTTAPQGVTSSATTLASSTSNAISNLELRSLGGAACKSVRIVSSGRRVAYGFSDLVNLAEFYLDGEKLDFETKEGINVVTVDPVWQDVLSTRSYSTVGWRSSGQKQLVSDFNELPSGTIVLVAVQGKGMGSLKNDTISSLGRAGAMRAAKGRAMEGYLLIGQIGGRALAEKVGRLVEADALLPCVADRSEPVPENAVIAHEASKCLPVMWDKVEVGGPPYMQVTDASGSFPGSSLRVIDTLPVHPICSRLSVALNMWEMAHAPYPNPDEWGPSKHFSLSTGADAFHKGNPQWVARGLMDFCLNPDTAVCTSYAVCWAMITRHLTKLIHRFCDEKARAFPEMPINDD